MERLTGKQWTEIAIFSGLTALASWMIYHGLNSQSTATDFADAPLMVGETQPPITTSSFPTLGLPPLQIGSGNQSGAGCGCDSCAAGQTVSPTIQTIVNQTNAAIASMQQMVNQTIEYEAQLGDQVSGGMIDYEMQPVNG